MIHNWDWEKASHSSHLIQINLVLSQPPHALGIPGDYVFSFSSPDCQLQEFNERVLQSMHFEYLNSSTVHNPLTPMNRTINASSILSSNGRDKT